MVRTLAKAASALTEMPMGTRRVETGILRPSQYGLYALEMDGGGT